MNTLLEDDERSQQYGTQALARVEEMFIRQQMLQSVQTVYDEVTD